MEGATSTLNQTSTMRLSRYIKLILKSDSTVAGSLMTDAVRPAAEDPLPDV